MKIKLVDMYSDIVELSREWTSLLQRSRANTIFLSHEWVCSWLKIHESSIDPYVLTVRDDKGCLVGVAPFYRTKMKVCKIISYRSLRIMGDYATGSDYLDLIIDNDCENVVANAILQYLISRKEWDLIWIPKISADTNACERLTTLFTNYSLITRVRTLQFSIIELPKSYKEYLDSLRPSKRKELTYKWRRLNRNTKIEFTQCSDPADLEECLEHLFSLHKQRWKYKNLPGVFDRKPAEKIFYKNFSPIALERDWLRIFMLSCDSVIQAIQFGYEYNNSFYSVQEGFNPEYYSGIGNLLRLNVIKWCINRNLKYYDFLADHSEHKISWSARPHNGCHIFALRKNLKNILPSLLNVWPTGRYIASSDIPI